MPFSPQPHDPEEHPMTEQRCCYIIDGEGMEQPCDRPATGWRWYQDVEHEDCLAVACSFHSNEGGRRMHEMDVELRSLRGVVQAVESPEAIEAAAIALYEDTRDPGYDTPEWDWPNIDRSYDKDEETDDPEWCRNRYRHDARVAIRAALAAAADAPQPEAEPMVTPVTPNLSTAAVTHQSWCSLALVHGASCNCRTDGVAPQPADPPTTEQR
jgi:hypothetical protein